MSDSDSDIPSFLAKLFEEFPSDDEEVEKSAEQYVKENLENVALSSKHEPPLTTILRVTTRPPKTDESLCSPCMVSIGPHHSKTKVLPKDHKFRLLKSFLCRNSELSLEHCIQALTSLHQDAWQCYKESEIRRHIPRTGQLRGPNHFVVMLLLDGCFILELFLKWLDEESDFLFTERKGQRLIFSDLLLFDNQIPFMVIEKLYDLVLRGPAAMSTTALESEPHPLFYSLLAKFLMNEEPTSHTSRVTLWPKPIHHLLDLYHQFLILTTSLCKDEEANHDPNASPRWKNRLAFSITPRPNQSSADRPPRQIPCATELHEVGIKFRKKQSPKNLLDVTFRRGILEIPLLQFDENKKILFYNLIALEKQKNWKEQIVTSYIVLMDSLINTKADIELLQRAGVIHNMLATHQEAAVFFNQLGGSLLFDTVNHHFAKLFRKVQRYYDSSWNRSWAHLFHHYFNSFWAILSVIAGVILLLLTGLQTFYTVYQYYRPH